LFVYFHMDEFFHFNILTSFILFSILFVIFSICLFKFILLSICIPKYLYCWTIGYPSISCSYSSLFLFYLLLYCMIPDFFLLIVILLFLVHSSTIFIASINYCLPLPMIAKSSTYANTWYPALLSSSSRSLNIIRNSVGDKTPPYMTDCPIFMCYSFVLILVYLYSNSIVLMSYSFIWRFRIFLKRISWFTVSNADFRSINKVQSFLSLLFSYCILIYSVILSMLTSHPIPFLNPV